MVPKVAFASPRPRGVGVVCLVTRVILNESIEKPRRGFEGFYFYNLIFEAILGGLR